MLALGLLTRPVALAIAIEMTVITRRCTGGPPLSAGVTIAWRGGGKYSLDRGIGREF
jgi:uncharacterized membrane protein YphA (DoxX/SURF4 family)